MKEPAFLREIHENQLKEYAKNKGKSLKERLHLIQKRANAFSAKDKPVSVG